MLSKDKKSKRDVKYGPGMPESHCAICTHFDSPHSCSMVNGIISPKGWCNIFQKKKKTKTTVTEWQ